VANFVSAYEFSLDLQPRDLYPPINRLSTDWKDLDVLVAERVISVGHTQDQHMNDITYQHAIKDGRTAAGKRGACVRWIINTKDDCTCTFSLDLQGLPMTASSAISKPSLASEEAPTVLLSSHRLRVDFYGGELQAVGPVVTFFAADVGRASVSLRSQPELLRDELRRLTWLLTSHEYLDLRSAAELVQHPREGLILRPFHPGEELPPARQHPGQKRSHDQDELSEEHSGKISKRIFHTKYPSQLPDIIEPNIYENIKKLLPPSLQISNYSDHFLKRFSQSLSESSWKRIGSALHSFQRFLHSQNKFIS
jgi:hypothetical protein